MKKFVGKTPPRKAISWDECFMRMAHVISERSKDPSTQAGAVIVDDMNVVVGMGYNGFPRGIDSEKLPWDREGKYEETKYAYVCHAEENAVYNTGSRSTKNCKIYSMFFPCNECVKTLIQCGVKEIIYADDVRHKDRPENNASKRLLKLAKISTRQYKSKFKW